MRKILLFLKLFGSTFKFFWLRTFSNFTSSSCVKNPFSSKYSNLTFSLNNCMSYSFSRSNWSLLCWGYSFLIVFFLSLKGSSFFKTFPSSQYDLAIFFMSPSTILLWDVVFTFSFWACLRSFWVEWLGIFFCTTYWFSLELFCFFKGN